MRVRRRGGKRSDAYRFMTRYKTKGGTLGRVSKSKEKTRQDFRYRERSQINTEQKIGGFMVTWRRGGTKKGGRQAKQSECEWMTT